MLRIAIRALLALPLLLAVAGCGLTLQRDPVPAALVDEVQPLGLPGLREWGDAEEPDEVRANAERQLERVRRQVANDLANDRPPVLTYLSISGGGQWGAFGAGVLKGWSESGMRPEFEGVAAISTGAIVAPFIFLGPAYDGTVAEIYGKYDSHDLYRSNFLSGLLWGTALYDTKPLRKKIAQYMTPEIMAKIAAEHGKGRQLLVGTTDLDAGRPMLWDVTAIAASGHPGALDLIRQVILASASAPVVFPPVFIDVAAPDGAVYDEMHVDGGATEQVTFVSPDISLADLIRQEFGKEIELQLYVIVNNDLTPAYDAVKPRIADIGGDAVSSLIRGSGTGDLYRIWAITERDHIAYNAAWAPDEVDCPKPKEQFDPAFMKCLYEIGRRMYGSGDLWRHAPPFFRPGETGAPTS
jgi:hypothetical protein